MAQPLSGRLRTSLRFLPPPLPAAPSASLTSRFPLRGRRRAYHVSPICRGGEGRSYPPVVRHLRREIDEPSNLTTCRFGPSVSASFACSHSRRLSLLHWS